MARGTKQKVARIFLVDNHEIPREGLAALLSKEKEFSICGQTGDGRQALEFIRAANPDLLITSISLAGQSGLELIETLQNFLPDLPILVLTSYQEQDYGDRVFSAGAKGFVNKRKPIEVLFQAITLVLSGKRYISPEMQELVLNRFFDENGTATGAPVDRLTNREIEILPNCRLPGNQHQNGAIAP